MPTARVFVRRARGLGVSLDEIAGLLGLGDRTSQSRQRVYGIAAGHLMEIRAEFADLRRMERVLAAVKKACAQGTLTECPLPGTLEM